MIYSTNWYRGISIRKYCYVYGYPYKGLLPDPNQWLMLRPGSRMRKPKSYRIYNQTLTQCTGRTDKHGRLLFEGDLVRTKYGRICEIIKDTNDTFVGFNLKPVKGVEPLPDKHDMWKEQNLKFVGTIFDTFMYGNVPDGLYPEITFSDVDIDDIYPL